MGGCASANPKPYLAPKELEHNPLEGAEVDAARTELDRALDAVSQQHTRCSKPGCGSTLLESWDGLKTFHCYSCLSPRSEEEYGQLIAAERRVAEAIKKVDSASAPDRTSRDARQVRRGVTVGFLKRFTNEHACEAWPTWKVVCDLIKPATTSTRCRFCELPDVKADVGYADVFVSHCWGSSFGYLVSCMSHALPDEAIVWVDIFAVRQWPGNVADLAFDNIVRDTRAFLLCGVHLDSVASIPWADVAENRYVLPDDAMKMCAFFRVWCIVELAAALQHKKPVVMLLGTYDPEAKVFKKDSSMVEWLFLMLDVEKAQASVEADRARIIEDVRSGPGIDAVNALCRGCLGGAMFYLDEPEVLQSACGFPKALEDLPKDRIDVAFRAASAGGLIEPMQRLREMGADLDSADDDGFTALGNLGYSGWLPPIEWLVAQGAQVDKPDNYGFTPMMWAAFGGHVGAIEYLVKSGANIDACTHSTMEGSTPSTGWTAIMYAARGGFKAAVEALCKLGADVNWVAKDGFETVPLKVAADCGYLEIYEVLKAAGADGEFPIRNKDDSEAVKDGTAPLHSVEANDYSLKKPHELTHGAEGAL